MDPWVWCFRRDSLVLDLNKLKALCPFPVGRDASRNRSIISDCVTVKFIIFKSQVLETLVHRQTSLAHTQLMLWSNKKCLWLNKIHHHNLCIGSESSGPPSEHIKLALSIVQKRLFVTLFFFFNFQSHIPWQIRCNKLMSEDCYLQIHWEYKNVLVGNLIARENVEKYKNRQIKPYSHVGPFNVEASSLSRLKPHNIVQIINILLKTTIFTHEDYFV